VKARQHAQAISLANSVAIDVRHIALSIIPTQICERIVETIPVIVTGFHPMWARPYKRLQNEMMNEFAVARASSATTAQGNSQALAVAYMLFSDDRVEAHSAAVDVNRDALFRVHATAITDLIIRIVRDVPPSFH